MSVALDVLDILDIDDAGPRRSIIDKEALLRSDKKKSKNTPTAARRPDNVPREVWGLQSSLNNDLPPLMPTDDSVNYRQPKAVIGVSRVRRWQWTPFTNPARQDGLVLSHWRRERPESDAAEDYPFARYNKHVSIPEYTQAEYDSLLYDPKWSAEKTGHLMELARRFDLRFVHIRDRWDNETFPGRPSIEDLKERYYAILMLLDRTRGTNLSGSLRYDAAHERRRKQQLSLLYGRTKDQVEEEERLVQELQKIEARRRERERKKQDLQKLISQADTLTRDTDVQDGLNTVDFIKSDQLFSTTPNAGSTVPAGISQRKRPSLAPSASNNSLSARASAAEGKSGNLANSTNTPSGSSSTDMLASISSASAVVNSALMATGISINFSDVGKNSGVYLRSQRMKLPSNLGQKKTRIIDNFLAHIELDPNPPANAEIVEAFNGLRSKILLLYDLRLAQLHCDYELQTARLKLETFAPNEPLPIGLADVTIPLNQTGAGSEATTTATVAAAPSANPTTADLIDPLIMSALRDSDSKRPILPRHSLGVAGALAAAAGSTGLASTSQHAPPDSKLHFSSSASSLLSSPSPLTSQSSMSGRHPTTGPATPGSPSVLARFGALKSASTAVGIDGGEHSSAIKRRRRAAAVEQERVLKKLKIKGQLID